MFTEAEGFANGDATLRYIVEGRPLDGLYHRMGGWRPISSRSFETLKIPLVSGRTFSDRDALTAPGVVIINQAMADKWWPSGGAIGQRTVLGKGIGGVWNELHREIVGIVANVRDSSLDREPQPANYVPITQLRMPLQLGWLVRTQVDPVAAAAHLARAAACERRNTGDHRRRNGRVDSPIDGAGGVSDVADDRVRGRRGSALGDRSLRPDGLCSPTTDPRDWNGRASHSLTSTR